MALCARIDAKCLTTRLSSANPLLFNLRGDEMTEKNTQLEAGLASDLNRELYTGIAMNTEKWQAIETAAKDGKNILMLIDGNIHIGRWDFDCHLKTPKPYWKAQCENWCGKLWMRENQPTHWMQLPQPPM